MNFVNIEDLFHFPCHVFFKNNQGIYQDSNDYLLNLGLDIKSNDFIGNCDFDFFQKKLHIFIVILIEKLSVNQNQKNYLKK